MNKGENVKGNLLLLSAAFLWGMSFVASKKGLDDLGPFGFTAMRSLAACLLLLIVVWIVELRDRKKPEEKQQDFDTRDLLLGGICCGIALFAAIIVQQMGLVTVDAGKGGFITALYIVILPVFGVVSGQRFNRTLIVCMPLALAGLWLLCIGESFSIEKGDLLILICAIFYAVHIQVAGYFSPKADALKMSMIQFGVVTVLSGIGMFFFEEISLAAVLQAWAPIIYGGAISNGIGFTLQILAQKTVQPTYAGILLSMEACFAVLGGCVLLQEQLTIREVTGCILMLVAVILVQLPGKHDTIK